MHINPLNRSRKYGPICLHNNVRKLSELYDAHEKSIPERINRNSQVTNERLDISQKL